MMLVVNGGTRLAYLNLLFGENNYLYLMIGVSCKWRHTFILFEPDVW